MTGGAAASGYGASAEDRSQWLGPTPVDRSRWPGATAEDEAGGRWPGPSADRRPPAAPPAVPPPGPGGMSIGVLAGGAAAAGTHARAVDASAHLVAVSPELLDAIRVLRGRLPLLARTGDDGLETLDAELALLEEEAADGGRVERGRLARLRALLTGGATAAGGLAAGLAVVESIGRLIG
ncbi:hypothetical protein [Streptomyces zingiberis]|uniref:Uncharacterized protein n=1 Tax=Streptomyces zingiberis TaxID=2053010 RepID=A0ABX1BYT9_9ACTN|nr:hypothetical protein [Streptomyces zingiberis]NJQ00672.1 hypothetical protein [Streptomyces zingiberis]